MTERTLKDRTLSRGERLQIMLDAAELATLDDFRFANRMPSRAAAVRELLARGLVAEGYGPTPGAKSRAYGVLNRSRSRQNGSNGNNGGSADHG